MHFRESFIFLTRFAGHPSQIGSVTPSSRFLVKCMLDKVDWDNTKCIAELGAGTGVFTREIVKRAKPGTKILVFELDRNLRKMIADENKNYSGLKIFPDAQELNNIIHDENINELDFIISSLPFTVLQPKVSIKIFNAIQKSLKPSGHFIAYQYSSVIKRYLKKRFKSVNTNFVLLNVPPAFVYDCSEDARNYQKFPE